MAWKSVVPAVLIPLLNRIGSVKPKRCWWQDPQEARLLVLRRRSWNSTRPSVATRSSVGLEAGLLSSAATLSSKYAGSEGDV